jgi:hypothetical protein
MKHNDVISNDSPSNIRAKGIDSIKGAVNVSEYFVIALVEQIQPYSTVWVL